MVPQNDAPAGVAPSASVVEGVSPDEAEQAGLDVGVLGHRHLEPELAGTAHQVVEGLHLRQEVGAPPGVELLVLAGGPGQIPGVQKTSDV